MLGFFVVVIHHRVLPTVCLVRLIEASKLLAGIFDDSDTVCIPNIRISR